MIKRIFGYKMVFLYFMFMLAGFVAGLRYTMSDRKAAVDEFAKAQKEWGRMESGGAGVQHNLKTEDSGDATIQY